MTTDDLSPDEVAAVQKCERAYNVLRDELAKVIVGQNEVIEQVLIAIFARGHALLEAMPERQVSAGGKIHKLSDPCFVLATQNPVEQEGTYPLPEAQLDRFLLHSRVDYPSAADEWEVARRVTSSQMGEIQAVLSGD